MTLHAFEPRDPLVVRDGRPNDGRSESRTLGFPLPSVVAGVVRTALGRRGDVFDTTLAGRLLTHVELRGPVLRDAAGLLVPAPGDALVSKLAGGQLRTRALRPIGRPTGALTSTAGALVGLPGQEEIARGKPHDDVPGFWRWAAFERWLRGPASLDDASTRELLSGGVIALHREERVHVAVGPSFTAEDGKLFGTAGLRDRARVWDPRTDLEKKADREAGRELCFETEVSFDVDVHVADAALDRPIEGLRPMGGERRLVRWGVGSAERRWPKVPPWLLDHAGAGDEAFVRVILVTPAFVEYSLCPSCFSRPGVEVVAACVDRPVTLSGWDLAARRGQGAPKRTRRLAAPGTVYWLRLSGLPDERRRWVEQTWLRNVGDDEQLRRDGFGLAVVGAGRKP